MADEMFEEISFVSVCIIRKQVFIKNHLQQVCEFKRHIVQGLACHSGLIALQESGEQGLSMQVAARNARRAVVDVDEGGADTVRDVPGYTRQEFTLHVDIGYQVGIGDAAIGVAQLQKVGQAG